MVTANSRVTAIMRDCGKELSAVADKLALRHALTPDVAEVFLLASAEIVLERFDCDAVLRARLLMEDKSCGGT